MQGSQTPALFERNPMQWLCSETADGSFSVFPSCLTEREGDKNQAQ